MLGTNPAIATNAALFAAFDGEQFLPVIIGLIIGLGIVVAGLFMLRSKPVSAAQAPDTSASEPPDASAPGESASQPPAASVIQGRNPLWGLALPGLGLLLLGAAIFGLVIPFVQDLVTAQDKFDAQIKSSIKPWSMYPTATPPIPTPQFQIPQQQIQIPTYQPVITPPHIPAPPRIPQPVINRGGIIRPR